MRPCSTSGSLRLPLACEDASLHCRVVDVTPALRAVYDELVERAARPPFADRAQALRDGFLERCGRPDPGCSAAGVRDAAAWEDALVRGRLAVEIGAQMSDPAERATATGLAHSQRGVFIFAEIGSVLVARDLWSAAEFVLAAGDDVAREMAAAGRLAESPLCEARVMATDQGCAVLPGPVFHPLDARQHVHQVLAVAHQRGLDTDTVMDALLEMEHTWHTLSRVKVTYAYRPERLPGAD